MVNFVNDAREDAGLGLYNVGGMFYTVGADAWGMVKGAVERSLFGEVVRFAAAPSFYWQEKAQQWDQLQVGARAWRGDPNAALHAVGDLLHAGFVAPTTQAWAAGDYGVAVGHVDFLAMLLLAPTAKGIMPGAAANETALASTTAKAGPGAWGAASESMSARAAAYQDRITGAADGQVYRVGGVKFDGFTDGVLQEAKGPGYAQFVRNGEFQPWYRGADALVGQAQRQLGAAGGSPITWSFAESDAAAAARNLFSDRGISGINVAWAP